MGDLIDAAEREIAQSGLFDTRFYLAQVDEMDSNDALPHFCRIGCQAGLRPNPHFDPSGYTARYADVARSRLNPLLHYIRHGDAEGRSPDGVFDPKWYRTAYHLAAAEAALAHYLRYVSLGLSLLPCSSALAQTGQVSSYAFPGIDKLTAAEIALISESGLVDPDYYLVNGDDVYEAGVDPARHFCGWGWKESRKPNIAFDTDWYLCTNAEVRRLGMNPLTHYIVVGERAGRRPVIWFDPVWYRMEETLRDDQNALSDYLSRRRREPVSPNPYFEAGWYSSTSAIQKDLRDPFFDFLYHGTLEDADPSSGFSTRTYRRAHLGRLTKSFRHLVRPERSNPLIHYMLNEYLRRTMP
jgi:hypothetical protein